MDGQKERQLTVFRMCKIHAIRKEDETLFSSNLFGEESIRFLENLFMQDRRKAFQQPKVLFVGGSRFINLILYTHAYFKTFFKKKTEL